ncbi:Uncharacterized protein ChrSV_4233 [Chromobacterium vaccinii]|nr:Uncharacterized protein ChrSW_4233 [Chromobacterium vaccinii]QND91690.1 Uncharacterized protein ChrSV_4233 [Chromobacterium vaccinii]
MSEESLQNYSYLWDGSQPNWCLSPLPSLVELVVVFKDGADLKSLLGLKHVSVFSSLSSRELLDRFKGVMEVSVGQMNKDDAEKLMTALLSRGLQSEIKPLGQRYVIINRELNSILSIEDDDVYRKVKERMLAAGVKVIMPA